MQAHTHSRTPARADGPAGVRLPWWALALPVVAFCALFLLIAGPGQAHAAVAEGPPVGDLVRLVHRALLR